MGHAPPSYFFTGPYVMKDFEHYMRAWNGKLDQAARAQLEKNDLKHLATIYRGLRQMTTKKPVYTPADAYGLKLRLPNVPTWLAVWKAVDATPVPVPLPELYSALKTGKAEASEGDLPQIASFKLDEVQTHLIITNHLLQTGGIVINKPFFDKLSKADQDLIVKAAKETEDWANNKIKAGEAAILVNLQRKGMQVVVPDAESFRVKARRRWRSCSRRTGTSPPGRRCLPTERGWGDATPCLAPPYDVRAGRDTFGSRRRLPSQRAPAARTPPISEGAGAHRRHTQRTPAENPLDNVSFAKLCFTH